MGNLHFKTFGKVSHLCMICFLFHRENSYIEYVLGSSPNQRCEADPSEVLNEIDLTLRGMGRIKTSKTFPSLCRASMDTAIACLETVAKVSLLSFTMPLSS